MFKNVLSKIVGFGMVLCIVGSMALSVPGVRLEINDMAEPFNIFVPEGGDDD